MLSLERDVINSCAPQAWTRMSEEVKREELLESSNEFRVVAQKVNSTLGVHITSVERVQNPFLWGSYLLKKAEYNRRGIYVRELDLFHCTAASNISSITADNLDWRLFSRTKFGQGVSFSPSAEYANKYANFNIGHERALILTKVLVGNEIGGNKLMFIPPAGYDTSTGNRSQVYVKYCDHEFYPSYIAYYWNTHIPKRAIRKQTDIESLRRLLSGWTF